MPNDVPARPRTDSDTKTEQKRAERRKKAPKIPAVDELLGQLINLNGAVAMGALSPKAAGLFHRNIKTVLDVQMKRESQSDSVPNHEALIDLCREDPRLLSTLESFLSDEQVEQVLHEIAEDQKDGSA